MRLREKVTRIVARFGMTLTSCSMERFSEYFRRKGIRKRCRWHVLRRRGGTRRRTFTRAHRLRWHVVKAAENIGVAYISDGRVGYADHKDEYRMIRVLCHDSLCPFCYFRRFRRKIHTDRRGCVSFLARIGVCVANCVA